MSHQLVALRRAFPLAPFGFFHEMGAGKTYTTIQLAMARFQAGQIDRLLIVCPTTLIDTWADPLYGGELAKWMHIPYEVQTMSAGYTPVWKTNDRLKAFVVGVESLSIKGGRAYKFALSFAAKGKTMMAVDESSKIKNHKSIRTKSVIDIGGQAAYRNILTGTPITQGLQDLFAQFNFMDGRIIDCKNFTVFRNRYCVISPVRGAPAGVYKIIGYQRVEELLKKIDPYVHVVTKDQCMDLPDKIYIPNIVVEPSKEQLSAVRDLRSMYATQSEDKILETSTALERLTRYQQIIGGTFPYQEDGENKAQPIPGKNPKLDALLEILEDTVPNDAKVIIWARFIPEIKYIQQTLESKFGPNSLVLYHGKVTREERSHAVHRFQNDSRVRFFVSNQATGGYGLTLTAATYVIYYSNTFSYEERMQSEDRCHRKGQTSHVTYINIEMNLPEDRMILKAVRQKKDLADMVTEELQ